MIARVCLLIFISLVVVSVIAMALNEAEKTDVCKEKGGSLVRLYPEGIKCVDISKITLD